MKLLVSKSPWEIYEEPLGVCLARIEAAGYDALEIYLAERPEPLAQVQSLLREWRKPVIVQIGTGGATPAEHLQTLQQRYEQGLIAEPLFFNCQTGRDHFAFEDNLRIFERAAELEARHGVPIRHETHRGRALFNLPLTLRFLQALPQLRLTADLSHWFCVHESDLTDQEAGLMQALSRVDHIHARVGFAEGPQVSDPRNPLHASWLQRSMDLWRGIAARAQAEGREWLTVTPEFGPVGYMPLQGALPVAVADAWEINLWMRDRLRAELLAPHLPQTQPD